jgi:phosphoglycerate dehydrogenase-like enzyme
MRIVFHGENAGSFSGGFADRLGLDAEIVLLPDTLLTDPQRLAYSAADVIIGTKFDASLPRPGGLKLFHVPGAGYDGVDFGALPSQTVVCNCFGHEQAIAEYVMAALLARHVPLIDADRRLRQRDWSYWAGAAERVHDEIAGKAIGLLGFGHIGQAIARRAKAFEMHVLVANRSPVSRSEFVDRSFSLEQLAMFWGAVDFVVVSVPLTPETTGIVGADAIARMKPSAVLVNVGRGATVDEAALYDALLQRRIAGAVIDTWYRYPTPEHRDAAPSALPFHELSNVVMTPHMSGWTRGTIARRQVTIAENILRCARGEPCKNVVHLPRPGT